MGGEFVTKQIKYDGGAETVLAWWLITQDMKWKNLSSHMINAADVAVTVWKGSVTAVQLNMTCFVRVENKEPKMYRL